MFNSVKSIVKTITDCNSFILVTHIHPDGDALGSLLGLAAILESMGKDVFRLLEKPVPSMYRFLPDSGRVRTSLREAKEFAAAGDDVAAIALDCGDRKRLGDYGHDLLLIRPFLVIDHHGSNDGFGDACWIEPHRSSTGEMIFDLAGELGAELSAPAATCLYTAILTDTGSFRYETTSAHTFAVAGKLVGLGVRPDRIAGRIFDNYTPGRLRLLKQVLATMELFHRDRIAFIRVSRGMYEQTGTIQDDTENFINLPRSIGSVEVAVFLKETEDDRIAVSMRAKGGCNVAKIAGLFGGGGHRNAAGFRRRGTLRDVRDTLLPIMEEALEQGKNDGAGKES